MKRRSLLEAAIRIAYFLPAAVFSLLGFRLIRLTHPERIGHLAGELDCLVKERILGHAPAYRGTLLAPRNRVANRHFLEYWRDFFWVVTNPFLCRILSPLGRFRFARYRDDMSRYFTAIGETAYFNKIFSEWGERGPLLSLREGDIRRGEVNLRMLGLPDGARFVCLHCREPGYSPTDDHLHDYRNSNIESYLLAATALYERGLYSIRMGDPSSKPLPVTPGVIDYAHSSARADWMDVFLCARCEFFIGSSSGLYLIATAFGRPSALANLVPMSTAMSGGSRELGIPKMIWHIAQARCMGLREVLESPIGNFRFSSEYDESNLRPISNEPEEIRALALEMHDRLTGVASYDAYDEVLQRQFKALFRPGHYGYGSDSRIGRDFLRKYAHLLEDSPTTVQ